MALEDVPDDVWRALPYSMGYAWARDPQREGLHPDAIRFRLHGLEEIRGRPLGPDVWRGVEDALAGRPMSATC